MAVVTATRPTTTTMTIVKPSLKTVLTLPTATRFGVSRRHPRGPRSTPGTDTGADPAAGKARSALVAEIPFLHRKRTLMPFQGPSLFRAALPPNNPESHNFGSS